ncbi:MAG: hypothetical protein JSV21_06345 [Nitrospirota bacterium]|nr:MAG: hypothetical protein JSV21_06345 [Nitrospirota bacterium]
MKRIVTISLFLFLLISSHASADFQGFLDDVDFAVKVDYVAFNSDMENHRDVSNTIMLGLEGYYEFMDNLFAGVGIGYSKFGGERDFSGVPVYAKITFVPIEANIKYSKEVGRDIHIAESINAEFGVGAMYSLINEEYDNGQSLANNLLGGQIFAELKLIGEVVNGGRFTVGFTGKYQLTEQFKPWGPDFTYGNWRIGTYMGYMFE